eukprot:6087273-Ditylum_brightwellii.AAC.1
MKGSNGDIAAIICNIKHCEELKQVFSHMKPITKGMTGGVVSEVHIPNPRPIPCPAIYDTVINYLAFDHNEPYKVLDDQDEVMSTLIKRNRLHFYQCFDTPFARPDI